MLSIEDLRDLVRLLEEHPEWKAELRRLLLTDELLQLPAIVRELAAAQKRTEERVEELAAAQKRTEERVEELAAAQKRTEERVEELAAAQRRTEERVEELAEQVRELAAAQRRTEEEVRQLAIQVGHLSELIGAEIEVDAQDVLLSVMKGKGLVILEEPYSLDLDGEVDVVAKAKDRDGELWLLVEAKVRLRRREVLSWARRLQEPSFRSLLASKGIIGRLFPYAFGLRIYKEAMEVARERGIGLLDTRGEKAGSSEFRI